MFEEILHEKKLGATKEGQRAIQLVRLHREREVKCPRSIDDNVCRYCYKYGAMFDELFKMHGLYHVALLTEYYYKHRFRLRFINEKVIMIVLKSGLHKNHDRDFLALSPLCNDDTTDFHFHSQQIVQCLEHRYNLAIRIAKEKAEAKQKKEAEEKEKEKEKEPSTEEEKSV